MRRILIIDDEDDIREVAALSLDLHVDTPGQVALFLQQKEVSRLQMRLYLLLSGPLSDFKELFYLEGLIHQRDDRRHIHLCCKT